MEKITEYMELVELKQQDKDVELKPSQDEARLDGLQSENKHISLFSKCIQNFSVELNSKERQLNLGLTNIEGCNAVLREELDLVQKELAMKQTQLGTIEKSIEQQNEEFKSNEEKLGLARMKLDECCKNLAVKNKQLESVEESLQVRCKEFEVKKEEVESLKSLAASCNVEIEQKQTELEVMEKEVENVKISAANCNQELEQKQKSLAMVKSQISDSNSELELKQKELTMKLDEWSTVERSIEEHIRQLKSEDVKMIRVKDKLKKCCQNLSVKTKQLESVQKELEVIEKEVEMVKQNGLAMVRSLISDSNRELQLNQKQLETLQGLANVRSTELDSNMKKLCGTEKSVEQCQNKLNLEMKEFDANERNRKICRCHKELEEREEHFDSLIATLEERSRKLEVKEKQFEARVKEFELKEQGLEPFDFHQQAHQPDNFWTAQFDEKTSSLILTDEKSDHNLLSSDVLAALKSSPDPANFVLGLMQGSYDSQYTNNGGAEPDASIESRTLLMEKLIELSPIISPAVQIKAAKLAISWKSNLSLGSKKLMEVWAFLLFLAAYRLADYFVRMEILKLVLVATAQRNAPNICRLLDFTDKVPEIIEILIERKQHIDAARFSCSFGLLHKFPLQKCFEHIKVDEKQSVLKAILQCISDYKRRFRYDMQSTLRRIIELEDQKTSASALLTLASFNTQQQQLHDQNYRDELLFGGN